MDTAGRGQRLKSEPMIKKEPGVFIKSEFGPSLASLPMAPAPVAKKEASNDEKKSVLDNIPEHRVQSGFPRRRRGGNSLVHRVPGFHIRARYDKIRAKVDFTLTKEIPKSQVLDWWAVESEMFRKLHRAHFLIEPIEGPPTSLVGWCRVPGGGEMRFAVQVRPVPQPDPHLDVKHGVASGVPGQDVKDEKVRPLPQPGQSLDAKLGFPEPDVKTLLTS